jgi:hypothetical protein
MDQKFMAIWIQIQKFCMDLAPRIRADPDSAHKAKSRARDGTGSSFWIAIDNNAELGLYI